MSKHTTVRYTLNRRGRRAMERIQLAGAALGALGIVLVGFGGAPVSAPPHYRHFNWDLLAAGSSLIALGALILILATQHLKKYGQNR